MKNKVYQIVELKLQLEIILLKYYEIVIKSNNNCWLKQHEHSNRKIFNYKLKNENILVIFRLEKRETLSAR